MSLATPTRNGTRGRRQPGTGGPIGRWITKRVIKRVRRKGKVPGLGFDALVLTTIGRKSGLQCQTPVGWCLAGRPALPLEPRDGGHRGLPRGHQGQTVEPS